MLSWLFGGGLLAVLLPTIGVFFLFYLRLLPLRAPKRMLASLLRDRPAGGVSPFRALTLALAGTLGVGNIVGVANALWIGGAGAVLWMWVAALLAMVLKYAEILLAVRHRRSFGAGAHRGGAYYYIKDAFDRCGFWRMGVFFSALFSALMLFNSLSMGCVVQVNAVSSVLRGVIGIPPLATAAGLLLLSLPLFLRGASGISAMTEWLVPVMSGGYAILSAAVLILRRDAVGEAFGSIFRDAFSGESLAGGAIGFLTSVAVRTGVMRGLLSNEAGCGTSPTAHASAQTNSPAGQGLWGILEVFVDTVVLCTATALVILVSLDAVGGMGEDPVMMTVRAYSTVLGGWSEWFFAAAILCFGYATVVCWMGYAMECLRYLSRRVRWVIVYLLAYVASTILGSVCAPNAVWLLSDACMTTLTVMNLCALVAMRREIREETLFWYQKRG